MILVFKKNLLDGNMGNQKIPHLICLSSCFSKYLMLVLVGDGLTELSLTGSLGLEKLSGKTVGGKYR